MVSANSADAKRRTNIRSASVHDASSRRARQRSGTPVAAPVTPVPRLRGRFTLYDTPDGGMHIAYKPDGSETTEHFEIPGKVLKMAQLIQSGQMLNPAEIMKAMRD
jgi:hypothetical protein